MSYTIKISDKTLEDIKYQNIKKLNINEQFISKKNDQKENIIYFQTDTCEKYVCLGILLESDVYIITQNYKGKMFYEKLFRFQELINQYGIENIDKVHQIIEHEPFTVFGNKIEDGENESWAGGRAIYIIDNFPEEIN